MRAVFVSHDRPWTGRLRWSPSAGVAPRLLAPAPCADVPLDRLPARLLELAPGDLLHRGLPDRLPLRALPGRAGRGGRLQFAAVTRDDAFLLFEAVFLGAPFLSFMATILRASSPARYAPSSAPGAPGTERVWVKPGGCSGTLSATGARTERCGSAALGFCPSFALGLVFRHTVSSSALRLARDTRRADRVPDQPVRGRRHRATIVSACEEGAGQLSLPKRTTRTSRTGGARGWRRTLRGAPLCLLLIPSASATLNGRPA